jgi:hypothetical protein
MRLRCIGLAVLLALGARPLAAQAAREYRPQLFLTLPYWHGVALTLLTEQRLATRDLTANERAQGIALGTGPFEFGSLAFDVRQVRMVSGTVEHRYSPSATFATPVGAGFDLRDRVKLELRDIAGVWSRRYQNRASLEHRVTLAGTTLTPYVYYDLSYDTRYAVLNRRQGAIGARVRLTHGTIVEPFLVRQTDTRKSEGDVLAFGMILRAAL